MKANNIGKVLLVVAVACSVVSADDFGSFSMDFANISAGVGDTDPSLARNGYGAVGYNYRIGTYEVSISQFQASGIVNTNADDWSDGTLGSLGTDAPAVNISWHQAAQYCNWLTMQGGNSVMPYMMDGGGKVTNVMLRADMIADGGMFYVLPSENEWYRAAYCKDGVYSLYANGTSSAPVKESEALYDSASPWVVTDGLIEQNDTYNMMGNVWEHLESPYADESLDFTDDTQEMVSRGGAYTHAETYLSAATRNNNNILERDLEVPQLGMRIVAIPEPGTISLMGLSTIGLFFARNLRRRKLIGKSLLPVRSEPLCDTFSTLEEWEAAQTEMGEADSLAELRQLAAAWVFAIWSNVRVRYKTLDKVFWNRMVTAHECRMARRQAFRKTLKKKALKCFDEFLSLIMK